ncbi:unnamed protein product [Rotaria sp. Silwood1]|nr:unnamed protein product [Rotaria sp. Silwood1]
MNITRKIDAEMLKNITYPKSLPFMMSPLYQMKQIKMTLKQHLIQFMKKVFYHASNNQPYPIAFIDSLSIYFDKIQNHVELTCQFSTGDIHDLLRFKIFISEIIYINIYHIFIDMIYVA